MLRRLLVCWLHRLAVWLKRILHSTKRPVRPLGWQTASEGDIADRDTGAYVHWWQTKEKPHLEKIVGDDFFVDVNFVRLAPLGDQGKEVGDGLFDGGKAVPLPKGFGNPATEGHLPWTDDQVQQNLPRDVPQDTVITGILDTGIALNHMRTNIAPGQSRVIAAWQQGVMMEAHGDGALTQPWLPCGHEIHAKDIDAALAEYGDADGVVDETGFNRFLRLSQPQMTLAHRELEMAAAHGTHTLDLAAGLDPLKTPKDELRRQRIIAVNLPAQYTHGTGGNFLAYFAVYGVERILHLADALWRRNKDGYDESDVVGYPVVINFSYGMVAGPKDGYHVFERAFRKILEDRERRFGRAGKRASPVRIIMPAGNDNLWRGAASVVMGRRDLVVSRTQGEQGNAAEEIKLPWRIQPQDATSNFVELWTEAKPRSAITKALAHLKVFVTPPDQDRKMLEQLKDGAFQNLGDFARVYCHLSDARPDGPLTGLGQTTDATDPPTRLALLICVAPTTGDLPGMPIAPAGLWHLDLEYSERDPIDVSFHVQSDQSHVVTSRTGRRSYFDDARYRAFKIEDPDSPEETGAVADTFTFRYEQAPIDNDGWAQFGPVQRRGTHNALSTLNRQEIIAVGGYNDGNGFPAAYSASTDFNLRRPDGEAAEGQTKPASRNSGRRTPTLCYPSENAPSLFGVLGAATRDGSTTAARGTSMATALATRQAARAFADLPPDGHHQVATEDWFRDLAKKLEDEPWNDALGQPGKRPTIGTLGELKFGAGRMPDPRPDLRVRRIGGSEG